MVSIALLVAQGRMPLSLALLAMPDAIFVVLFLVAFRLTGRTGTP